MSEIMNSIWSRSELYSNSHSSRPDHPTPQGWRATRLGEMVIGCSSGATPSRFQPSFFKGKIRWITSGELNYNVITDTIEKITEDAVERTHLKILPTGTFLMAITGLEAEGTRGSCGIIGAPSTTNQSCMAILPTEHLLPEYLFHYYVFRGKTLALQFCQGTKQQSYTAKTVKDLPILFPEDIGEQRAIAAALSDADKLIGALDALIAKKRAIKQATMQQLLTGKKRLPGFEGEWIRTDLRSLCVSITDGTHYTPKYVDVGIPFYSVETLTQNEFINTKHISPEEHEELIKRCKPERGDILLTRIGSLGETKLIDWDVNASIYVSLALLKVKVDVCSEYLYAYTKSRQFVSDVGSRALLNASPKKINMEDIGDIPISVPPSREEQHTIGVLLLDMDAEITALERRREKAQQIKQGMMQQLLTGKVRLVESGCKGAQPYAE